jgi:hypothetical protein
MTKQSHWKSEYLFHLKTRHQLNSLTIFDANAEPLGQEAAGPHMKGPHLPLLVMIS